MTTPRSAESTETSLTQDVLYAARYYLGSRRGLLVLAGLAITAGVAWNWSWLVAAGIAPILISVLPCVAMCALGLCMNSAGGKSCSTGTAAREPTMTGEDAIPTTRTAPLEAPGDAVTAELFVSPDGAPLTNPDPQLSEERRLTDA